MALRTAYWSPVKHIQMSQKLRHWQSGTNPGADVSAQHEFSMSSAFSDRWDGGYIPFHRMIGSLNFGVRGHVAADYHDHDRSVGRIALTGRKKETLTPSCK